MHHRRSCRRSRCDVGDDTLHGRCGRLPTRPTAPVRPYQPWRPPLVVSCTHQLLLCNVARSNRNATRCKEHDCRFSKTTRYTRETKRGSGNSDGSSDQSQGRQPCPPPAYETPIGCDCRRCEHRSPVALYWSEGATIIVSDWVVLALQLFTYSVTQTMIRTAKLPCRLYNSNTINTCISFF